MRTTITIEDDVFQAVQALARASGKRQGEVVSELVRRALKAEARVSTQKSGLPVFKVSPQARVIPTSRASEMVAEERG